MQGGLGEVPNGVGEGTHRGLGTVPTGCWDGGRGGVKLVPTGVWDGVHGDFVTSDNGDGGWRPRRGGLYRRGTGDSAQGGLGGFFPWQGVDGAHWDRKQHPRGCCYSDNLVSTRTGDGTRRELGTVPTGMM